MFGRRKEKHEKHRNENLDHFDHHQPSKQQLNTATRARKVFALLTSFLLLLTIVFLVLVELGNTKINPTLNKIYFIKLNLADIVPVSVPNAVLINSIAQTLGLHDFYTVGLWNFCEGYLNEGTTNCSPPKTLYWFNPIEIIQSELLSGATIALPADVDDILKLIRLASHWMFGLFLTGACLAFVMMFIVPLAVYSRWASLPIALFTGLTALFTAVAAVVATVMFIIMQNTITQATQLNIGASIGIEMFAFIWIAAGSAVLAFIIQLGMCCCCASRRDVKTGRRHGSKKAWSMDGSATTEKEPGRFRSSS